MCRVDCPPATISPGAPAKNTGPRVGEDRNGRELKFFCETYVRGFTPPDLPISDPLLRLLNQATMRSECILDRDV